MTEYNFSKKDIIQDDITSLNNKENESEMSQDNTTEQFFYESDFNNQNTLYDLCSFGIIALCIFEILYCLFVNYNSYNYYIITAVGLSTIVLYLYSNSLKTDENSTFNNFANDYLTLDYTKSSILFTFNIITKALCYLVLLYPVTLALLWILSITNIISADTIQHLPYCYHPNCNGFYIFIMCFIYAAISSKLISLERFGWGGIIGAIVLYTFFDQKLFDTLASITGLIGICIIILVLLCVFIKAAAENAENQDNDSDSDSFHATSSDYQDDLENAKKEINSANSSYQKQEKMIGSAVQKGSVVEVYDTNGSYLFSRGGELNGFTATSVSIKKGRVVEVYDARGSYKYSRSCY